MDSKQAAAGQRIYPSFPISSQIYLSIVKCAAKRPPPLLPICLPIDADASSPLSLNGPPSSLGPSRGTRALLGIRGWASGNLGEIM